MQYDRNINYEAPYASNRKYHSTLDIPFVIIKIVYMILINIIK
jgi:hypothetical protein